MNAPAVTTDLIPFTCAAWVDGVAYPPLTLLAAHAIDAQTVALEILCGDWPSIKPRAIKLEVKPWA